MDTVAILLIIWALTMNYSWFTRNRKDGEEWHWTIFLGPVAYEHHVRDERNEAIRNRNRIADQAADAYRKAYIWR